MSMTDPIADLLTRIRNACLARHRSLDVPASRMKDQILKVLQEEGYIDSFRAVEGAQRLTRITLRFYKHQPVIQNIRRVSTPGLRRYIKAQDIPRVVGGLGVAILSTPAGVISGDEAKRRNVGGELIATVW